MIVLRILLTLLALAPGSHAGSQAQATEKIFHRDLASCSPLTKRREWRSMSKKERASWITSVKVNVVYDLESVVLTPAEQCLASLDHQRLSFTVQGTTIDGTHSLYDDFAIAHAEMEKTSHKNSNFLPWHRWFLYLFDATLRDTCGYSGPTPFWDWSLDVANLLASPIFDPDPVYGLGGSGDCTSSPTSDCLVIDGAFATQDSIPFLTFPVPHSLRRNLSLYTGEVPQERPQNTTLNPTIIEATMRRTTPGNFLKFQRAIESMHDHVHNFIGGDLAGTCPKALKEVMGDNCSHAFTPNEPLFWLHHAQLDRLWSKWQQRHPDNFYAFSNHTMLQSDFNSSTSILRFDRLSVSIAVDRVFNHSAPPLCYEVSEEERNKIEL